MDYYKQEVKDILNDLIAEGEETRADILKRWAEGETEDDFGNLTGSRFCSRYEAEKALNKAGFPWDSDLNDLLEEVGYNVGDLLKRGAEVVDVVLCELVAGQVAYELMEEEWA